MSCIQGVSKTLQLFKLICFQCLFSSLTPAGLKLPDNGEGVNSAVIIFSPYQNVNESLQQVSKKEDILNIYFHVRYGET